MPANRIVQTLHDEHRATIGVLERLAALLAAQRGTPPDAGAPLLGEVALGIESEVERHFDFEEQHLFTFLSAIGDAAIGAHLSSEHEAMRPLGRRLAALARTGAQSGFDATSWAEFRQVSGELSERMLIHIQKEEMALLPLLEEAMDAETEMRLFESYSGND